MPKSRRRSRALQRRQAAPHRMLSICPPAGVFQQRGGAGGHAAVLRRMQEEHDCHAAVAEADRRRQQAAAVAEVERRRLEKERTVRHLPRFTSPAVVYQCAARLTDWHALRVPGGALHGRL